MDYLGKLKLTFSQVLVLGVVLALLLVIACAGSAATPVVVEKQVIKEVIKEVVVEKEVIIEVPLEVVVEKEVVKEVIVERIVVAKAAATPVPAVAKKVVDKLSVMGMSLGNEQWNPALMTGTSNAIWWRPLHARLISTDDNLSFDPANSIASTWGLTDGGLGWEFTIREGVKFHNGEELDVEDVIFSQREIFQETRDSVDVVRLAREIDQHATKTGPNTMKILFTEPKPFYTTWLSEVRAGSTGAVMSKDYYESVGGDKGFQADPNPGTAGPFTIVRHRSKQEILYERFDDYYLKDLRPYPFRQLSVLLVPELATRVAALAAGEADIITADLNVLDQVRSAGGKIVYSPEGNYIWILAHHCQKPTDQDGNPIMCNDKRVREALDYAIDKEEIQEMYGADVFQIKGGPSAAPSALGYETNLDPYPYDPDKARQLLADAGYPDGKGFNGGRIFNIWTFTAGAVPLMVEQAQLVCSQWNRVLNIDCTVKVGEEGAVKDRFYGGMIDGQYLVRPNDYKYDAASQIVSGFAIPDAYGSYVGDVDGPRIKELIATVGTLEERHRAYNEALLILHKAHMDHSSGYLNTPYGLSKRIKSWKPLALQSSASALWTIEFK